MVAAKQLETSACRRQVQTIRKVRGVGPGSRDPGSGIRDLSPKVAKSNMLQSRRPERPRSSRDHHSKPLGAIYPSSPSTFAAGVTLKSHPGSRIRDPGSRIPDPGSRMPDPGSGIPDPGSGMPDPGSRIRDPGSESHFGTILEPRMAAQQH